MSSIGIVIQARMGSARLPGKVLMDFCGKPLLKFQIDLLRSFSLGMEIVVATSINPLDDAIAEFCESEHIPYVRGSETNVFSRYQVAVKKFGFSSLLRLTADNPLTNFQILDSCVKTHLQTNPDLTSTRRILSDRTVKRFAPKGSSIDIIKGQTLLKIAAENLDDFEKEHVIPVFYTNLYRVSVVKDFRHLKATYSIDTINDYKKVSAFASEAIKCGKLMQVIGYHQ
jgi:spore coat polysaccharide biosynthesis protein SpsF